MASIDRTGGLFLDAELGDDARVPHAGHDGGGVVPVRKLDSCRRAPGESVVANTKLPAVILAEAPHAADLVYDARVIDAGRQRDDLAPADLPRDARATIRRAELN